LRCERKHKNSRGLTSRFLKKKRRLPKKILFFILFGLGGRAGDERAQDVVRADDTNGDGVVVNDEDTVNRCGCDLGHESRKAVAAPEANGRMTFLKTNNRISSLSKKEKQAVTYNVHLLPNVVHVLANVHLEEAEVELVLAHHKLCRISGVQ